MTSKYLRLSSCGTALIPGTLHSSEQRCVQLQSCIMEAAEIKGNSIRFRHETLRLLDDPPWQCHEMSDFSFSAFGKYVWPSKAQQRWELLAHFDSFSLLNVEMLWEGEVIWSFCYCLR